MFSTPRIAVTAIIGMWGDVHQRHPSTVDALAYTYASRKDFGIRLYLQ